MVPMDLKGISWFSDMYQRLEAVCLEVDETMYQDTVKYVEDQIRTVGVSVKKFCADVMQDLLLPTPLDSVKSENVLVKVLHHADIAFCDKPKVDNKKESMNTQDELLVKDSYGAANIDISSNYGSYKSKSHDFFEEQCRNEIFESQCSKLDLSNLDTCVTKDLDNREKSVPRESSGEFICSKPLSKCDEPLWELRNVSSMSASVVEVCHSDEDGVGIFEVIQSNGSVHHVEGSERFWDASPQLGVPKQLNTAKFEESCVLVEHPPKLLLQGEKSYKTKIRDAFSGKRWSKTKQAEKQSAVMHAERSAKNSVSHSLMHAEKQKPQKCKSFESDWELL